jgi:hypothetical protein
MSIPGIQAQARREQREQPVVVFDVARPSEGGTAHRPPSPRRGAGLALALSPEVPRYTS